MAAPAASVKRSPFSLNRASLSALLTKESEASQQSASASELPPLDERLLLASFGSDAALQREAALELARQGRFAAARTYLLISIMHEPLNHAAVKDVNDAVDASRTMALKKQANSETEGVVSRLDVPRDWLDQLGIVHVLLCSGTTWPAADLKTWIKMILMTSERSQMQLAYAIAALVSKRLVDHKRWTPPIKVLAYEEKAGSWTTGTLVPTPAAELLGPATKKNKLAAKENEQQLSVQLKFITVVDGKPVSKQRIVTLRKGHVLRDSEIGTPRAYVPALLLHEAAALGRENIFSALLDVGVSEFESDEEGSSAFLQAAFHATSQGHRNICKQLLERGGGAEIVNMNAMSPWDACLMRSDAALRRLFRPSESDKDFTHEAKMQTALHRAILNGDETLAAGELGSPTNIQNCKVNKITPLMMAARFNQPWAAQRLLELRADPELTSSHGMSAFSIAAEEGHVEIMEIISTKLSKLELMKADECNGTDPLMRACENGHVAAVESIIELDIDMNRANDKGWTALMLAAYNGFDKVIALMLECGARPDMSRKVSSKRGKYTALCYACLNGHLASTRWLVDSGCSLDAQLASTAHEVAVEHEQSACASAVGSVGSQHQDSASLATQMNERQRPSRKKSTTKAADVSKEVDEEAAAAEDAKERAAAEAAVAAAAKAAAKKDAAASKERLNELRSQEEELINELKSMRDEMNRLRLELKDGSAKRMGHRPPWVFSPSGRWRAADGTQWRGGLWQLAREQEQPWLKRVGERPPDSYCFAKTPRTFAKSFVHL